MATTLRKFKSLLPADQSQQSNSQRNSMWERWDTNLHGFLKLSDIEDGLNRQFDFDIADNIAFIISKANQMVRQTLQVNNVFGPGYLQKKQFRLFVSSLDNLLQKMLIFEQFDSNRDNKIECQDLAKAIKVFQKWGLQDQQIVEIYRLSSSNSLDLNNFLGWISSLPYYSLNDIK